mmetsp:Transcript_43312/g.101934  ORF Transcript_43312/g.101934 Transcript_43312/m.101934 type:complete len:140 (+) Transcript_43312:578-997(+)
MSASAPVASARSVRCSSFESAILPGSRWNGRGQCWYFPRASKRLCPSRRNASDREEPASLTRWGPFFFITANGPASHDDYVAACAREGLEPVESGDKRELLQYLNGHKDALSWDEAGRSNTEEGQAKGKKNKRPFKRRR